MSLAMSAEPWMCGPHEEAAIMAAIFKAEERAKTERRRVVLMSDLSIATLNRLPRHVSVVEIISYQYRE
jgi:hypothetical protein